MSKLFFNTNKERGHQLAASERKALTQNDYILGVFALSPDFGRTAWEMNNWLSHKNWPITSVRRALSTMADSGLLKETGEMRKGGFGKLNRVYQITKAGLNYKTK